MRPNKPNDRSRRADARPSASGHRSPIEGDVPPPSSTLPPPTPVISITSSDEPAAPKRGWWGKRLLGDKG